ncbi:MAG TPA: DUF4350 domain-containing protein [Tepidisphaeraceae bacterium]
MLTKPAFTAFRFLALTLALSILLASQAHAAAEPAKPALLYSRYFNAKGEKRYLPDGTYKLVLDRLKDRFDVRASDEPLNAQTLKGVSVVLIANPSDKAVGKNPPPHHVSSEDVEQLTQFVHNGGGLVAMGNQENHNLEIADFNRLLEAFGMKFENRYTDAKQLVLPASLPIIGGLRWAYYTGNQVVIQPDHPAKPRGLVVNDLSQKPLGGPRDEPGILLATAEPGNGHVVVVTDAGWISNDALTGKGIGNVSIKDQDNYEIFLRLAEWAAGTK